MISSLIKDIFLLLDQQLAPFLVLGLAITLIILGQILNLNKVFLFWTTGLCMVLAWLSGFQGLLPKSPKFFLGLTFDSLGHIGIQFVLPGILCVLAMAMTQAADRQNKLSSLLLVLLSSIGALVLLVSQNWMIFFIALQGMTIPLYGLLAFHQKSPASIRASTKYLVLSAFSMGTMLFGIMLLYASTQTLSFPEQALKIHGLWSEHLGLLLMGFSFVLVGIAFKLSVFPFHAWAPDVYQGAPWFVTAYMIVVAKGVVLLAFLRLWLLFIGDSLTMAGQLLGLMAILSMWVGNLLMLFERHLIRLLAFSSIAHLGYALMAVKSHSIWGVEAICIDLLAYGVSVLLVMAAFASLHKRLGPSVQIENLQGLFQQNPFAAILLSIGFLSLAGIPLTAGFIGKYAVILAGVNGGLWMLVFNMILSSLLGIFAFFRILTVMFQAPSEKPMLDEASGPVGFGKAVLLGGLLLVVGFGVYPAPALLWVRENVAVFLVKEKVPKEGDAPPRLVNASKNTNL